MSGICYEEICIPGPSYNGDSYSLSSSDSSGISGSFNNAEFGVSVESSAGRFFAHAGAGGCSNEGACCASASASVIFQPETSGWLHATFSVVSVPEAKATLSDLTANVPLLLWNLDWLNPYHSDYWVYGTHQYKLDLSVLPMNTVGGGGDAYADLAFTPVPEPATLLLLGLGAAVAVRKRKI